MTASTEQERASYEGGAWYWVEKEGWDDEPPKIAPAMYRADCDAWYSWEFSGISTPYLKVLEPCTRTEQASRRAQVVPAWVADGVHNALAFAEEDSHQLALGSLRKLHERIAAAPQTPEWGFSVSNAETSAAPVQLPEPDFKLDGGAEHCYYADTVRQLLAAQIDPQLLQAIQRAGFQVVKGALGLFWVIKVVNSGLASMRLARPLVPPHAQLMS